MAVAEILAGISLVKASVDFIKSNIDTAKDVGEIAGAIDGLFRGAEDVQKERNRKSKAGLADQFGINNVAQEMIDAKLAEEKMHEMRTLVDLRFGPGTWQSIIDERSRRIAEAKEAARLAAIKKRQEDAEFWEQMKMIAIIGSVIVFAVGAFVFVMSQAV